MRANPRAESSRAESPRAEEVRAALRVLGLEPGATPEAVRSAFRRLARAHHPDAGGGEGAIPAFQRITGAYSLLKGLTPEALECPQAEGHGTLFDWYRHRRSHELHPDSGPKPAPAEGLLERERRVDRILERYEREVGRLLEREAQGGDQGLLEAILLRLGSDRPEVRRLALGRVGALVNRAEVRQALTELLTRHEVDEGTARLLAGLPMTPETRRRLAADLAGRAAGLPNALLSSLLPALDPALLERYLASASPAGVPLLLRAWPKDRAPTDATLRRLLESDRPEALVPVLSTMKQHFPESAQRHRKRLAELEGHPAPAVRVWSQALLS